MYTPKKLYFDDEGREMLKRGIYTIAKAVKSTLGPRGQTVLIESQEHLRGITVTKDGVTVAKSVALQDPVENLAVRIMKEASELTSTQAGDGTTTAIVLTEAIINATEKRAYDFNSVDFLRELDSLTDDVIEYLSKCSIKLSKKNLQNVAAISCNNDAKLGKIVADVYNAVGRDGVVTVEKSKTSDTHFEVTKGLQFKRGYVSPAFITNREDDECVFDDAKVLLCENEISSVLHLEPVLRQVIENNDKLLIVANCSMQVVNTLGANVVKNGYKFCVIEPPQFGWKQKDIMSDLSLSLGAKYFSDATGDDLSHIKYEDLGSAKKVVVNRDATTIFRDESLGNEDAIAERVKELRASVKTRTSKDDKDFVKERIASLNGGVGVVYAGGHTDLEQKELYDRLDDAVCAVQSAMADGVVPGGGIALLEYGIEMAKEELSEVPPMRKLAAAVLCDTLEAPFRQILSNAGLDADKAIDNISDHDVSGYGLNVKTEEYGDMMKMGVIDPAKVTKSALRNAVSVASTIISTNAIVTAAREYETRD